MSDTEKQIIKKAKAGDAESFEKLIQGSQTKAFHIAMRYLQNEEDAMDALQESYIKVFRSLNSFKEESSFDTWVYRIVVNTCNDSLRRNSKFKTNVSIYRNNDSDEEFMMDFPDSGDTPESILENKEKMTFILASLEKLPSDQREALELRDMEGFSYEEIATMLNCSLGTVKSRISRGRIALRQLIIEAKELNNEDYV